MTPAVAHWPSWAHAATAMGLAFVGILAFYGCLAAADSPLGRHLLGACSSAACWRCVAKKRRDRIKRMEREARK